MVQTGSVESRPIMGLQVWGYAIGFREQDRGVIAVEGVLYSEEHGLWVGSG